MARLEKRARPSIDPCHESGRSLVALFGVMLASWACSDGDGDTEGQHGGAGAQTATAATAPADRCREDCEVFAKCEGFPLSGCAGDISCSGWPAANWRDEVAFAYLGCQQSCLGDPDRCISVAFDAAGASRGVDDEYDTACSAKEAACPSLPNNVCGEQSLYLEDVVAQALGCLTEECFSVDTCLDGVFF